MTVYNHSSTVMEEIEDNSVQCIITSPPYPMIKKWDESFKEQIGYENPDGGKMCSMQHGLLYKV